MATNILPSGINPLFTLAQDMLDGCHTHETAVGLKQNKEADLQADFDPALAAQMDFTAASSAKTPLSTAVTVADSNAKHYISAARRVLVNYLGDSYSQLWDATGFPNNSTAVPPTQPERQALLLSLKNYFLANAAQANASLNVTALQAGALFDELSGARTAAAEGNTVAGQKKNTRDAAEKKLRARMSGLITELGQLLDDTDPLWLAFGLNEPGATNLPDPADSLILTAGTAGTVLGDWGDSARATHYRVFKQIVGVDAALVFLFNVTDSDCTLSELPSGKTVRVQVIAANDAGQAAPTVAEIVVP